MSSAANPAFDDYQYQPLDHATQQIRLVTLLDPLVNDDAIRLDIEVFEISEAPPYTALSYVWGPPPSYNDIYIADGRLKIRENLFKFLTEFRKCRNKTPSDRYMWIDQLCIDQSSTVERNHQVQMMSDIYSKATSVVAWLGDGSEKPNSHTKWLAEGGYDKFENTYDAACVWRDTAEIAAFTYVLHNKYFRRLWIVQEFILAKQIRILVKDVWLVDDTRRPECQSETFYDYIRQNVPASVYRIMCNSSLRRTGGFIHLGILDALDRYVVGNECADPRDNVYGLLGLVDHDQRVTVDYEKSIDQLFMDVALAALRNQCLEGLAAESPKNRAFTLCWQAALGMDITWAQKRNFHFQFYKICHSDRLGRFSGHACPITAIGLEEAARTGCEVDQFWFDFQGTRHIIYCTDEITTQANETERLLREDWAKYVPQEHGDETS